MELVFREYGVRVFYLVHVWKSWYVVVKSWVCLLLYVVVYLDGSAASVLPGAEGVGGWLVIPVMRLEWVVGSDW